MQSDEKRIRIDDIFYPLIKGWRFIVSFTFVGLIIGIILVGAGYLRGEILREYNIKSSVAVVAQNREGTFISRSQDPNQNDIKLAEDITDPALFIFQSNNTLNRMIEKLKLVGIEPKDIRKKLKIVRYEDTQIIEMSLRWRSETEGLRMMTALIEIVDSELPETIKLGRVSVVDPPRATLISGSINASLLIFTVLACLLIGAAWYIVRFLIAPTIINEADMEDYFGIEIFESIETDADFAKQKPLSDYTSPAKEEIAAASHIIINRMEKEGCNKLYFTSTEHGEGVSKLVSGVAAQFAGIGKKTLLIDCNFKKPMLASMFEVDLKPEQSLNSLYNGESDKIDAIVNVGGYLGLLPVVLDDNPPNLNGEMLDVLKSAMEGYDYVFIDAMPVGEDAEVLELNRIADAVLFVTAFDKAYKLPLSVLKNPAFRLSAA